MTVKTFKKDGVVLECYSTETPYEHEPTQWIFYVKKALLDGGIIASAPITVNTWGTKDRDAKAKELLGLLVGARESDPAALAALDDMIPKMMQSTAESA